VAGQVREAQRLLHFAHAPAAKIQAKYPVVAAAFQRPAIKLMFSWRPADLCLSLRISVGTSPALVAQTKLASTTPAAG
jgi:hypothetical protein